MRQRQETRCPVEIIMIGMLCENREIGTDHRDVGVLVNEVAYVIHLLLEIRCPNFSYSRHPSPSSSSRQMNLNNTDGHKKTSRESGNLYGGGVAASRLQESRRVLPHVVDRLACATNLGA